MGTPEPESTQGAYLLSFSGDSATLLALPDHERVPLALSPSGELLSADLGELDPAAVISLQHDGAFVEPGSQPSGVRINGEPLCAGVPLDPGDVITLGGSALVFHHDPRRSNPQQALTREQFLRRLDQEIERCARYHRRCALLIVQLGTGAASTDDVHQTTAVNCLRRGDVVGRTGPGELGVLLAETDALAHVPALRVMQAMAPSAPRARAGLAMFPADGSASETLLAGARAAALGAHEGSMASVSESASCFTMGDEVAVAVDPKTQRLFSMVGQLAKSDIPVLVLGETGVGKGVLIRAMHSWSPRSAKRLLTINCAAMPESLLESELFGYRRGAFSGADSDKPGLFEAAHGGTLFLDEIGEGSPRIQAELLRVLETGFVRRVGSTNEHRVDVRVAAATNSDLEQEVAAGRFRKDLYYRINAAMLMVPPLRHRALDVPALAEPMLEQGCRRRGRPPMHLSRQAMQLLQQHRWSGNVRELKHVMEYMVAVNHHQEIGAQHLPQNIRAPWVAGGDLDRDPTPNHGAMDGDREDRAPRTFRKLSEEIRELERKRMVEALTATGGVRVQAARLLGVPVRTFRNKLRTHGLSTWPGSGRTGSAGRPDAP